MNELVALYPRVSTAEQATEGYSIPEQIDRMQSYCKAMGWTVYKVYTDAGYSGANTDRPALQRLITDVKAGKVNKVLVYKLDRLSRSQKDTLNLIEDIFLANKVDFVSMSENFDTSTPFGRAMVGILAVFAQLEREQIRERMNMGKFARAKLGLFGGSNRVPIGYNYVDGKLVTNDFEKLQIQEIFNLYASGVSPNEIVDRLNAAGYTHKFGSWNDHTLRRILRSKTYLGYIKFRQDWFKGEHEPFISEELFNAVQTILDRRTSDYFVHNRREGRVTSYLGGLLYCGRCGAKYSKYINKNNARHSFYTYYKCNTRNASIKHCFKGETCDNKTWRMEDLDALVLGEIKKLALDPAYFAEIAASPETDEKPVIQAEISKLDNQIARLMDLYTVGDMPLDLLQEKLHKLTEQKQKLQSELEQLTNKGKLPQADAVKYIGSFADVLDRGVYAEIRAVITALIEKIVIDGETVTIHWKFV